MIDATTPPPPPPPPHQTMGLRPFSHDKMQCLVKQKVHKQIMLRAEVNVAWSRTQVSAMTSRIP